MEKASMSSDNTEGVAWVPFLILQSREVAWVPFLIYQRREVAWVQGTINDLN